MRRKDSNLQKDRKLQQNLEWTSVALCTPSVTDRCHGVSQNFGSDFINNWSVNGHPVSSQSRQNWIISQERDLFLMLRPAGQLLSQSSPKEDTQMPTCSGPFSTASSRQWFFYKVPPPVTKTSQAEKNIQKPGWLPAPSGHTNAPSGPLHFLL